MKNISERGDLIKFHRTTHSNRGFIGIEAIIVAAFILTIGVVAINLLHTSYHVDFLESTHGNFSSDTTRNPISAERPENTPPPQAPAERPENTPPPQAPSPFISFYDMTDFCISSLYYIDGWTRESDGSLGSSDGILLASVFSEEYTVKIVASIGRGNASNFGILFETTLDSQKKDSGYVIYLARNPGRAILRHRTNGVDGPIVVTVPAPMVPGNMGDNWWASTREFKVKVVKSSGLSNQRLVSFYIDNVKLINNTPITVSGQTGSLTGIRAAKSYTISESLTIQLLGQ